MSLAQRSQWVEVAAAVLLLLGLGLWLNTQLSHTAPEDIRFGPEVGTVAIAINLLFIAIRTWVRRSTSPGDDFADERDRELGRRADAITMHVFMGLAVIPLVLGLSGAAPVWFVTSLLAAYLLAGLANALIRLGLYARG